MTARFARALALTALGWLSVAAPGCATEAEEPTSAGEDDVRRGGKMQLVVTVDWEGRDLRDDNLRAMESLRARFPQVKIVHFLNAAYYTKDRADPADTTARINRPLRPGDEKALHIHGWKRLFEKAGAHFVNAPTFWGTSISPTSRECLDDCGHEVPISLYPTDELRKVVRFSLDTLESHGLGRAKSFRCGGWMAKQSVRDAIAAEGISYEHSAVPTAFLQPKLASYPVYGWLSELWAGTTALSQPYRIASVANGAPRSLVEVPDNGALADYVSTEQMVEVFHANKAEYLRDKRRNVVVSLGFHEETAATYLPQLEGALSRIYEEVRAENLPLESVTSESFATR